jgi:hypothetical protein
VLGGLGGAVAKAAARSRDDGHSSIDAQFEVNHESSHSLPLESSRQVECRNVRLSVPDHPGSPHASLESASSERGALTLRHEPSE